MRLHFFLIFFIVSFGLTAQIGSSGISGSSKDMTGEYEPICLSDGIDTFSGFVRILGKSKIYYNEQLNEVTANPIPSKYCESNRVFFKDCFLPDQYANVWGWAGNGHLTKYDPLTGDTEFLCDLPVGGFALAFKNDVSEPTLFFQRSGLLYQASPDDPCGTFSLVGSTAPATSSYPCFDFDPSGRLLLGNGNQVWIVDPLTGTASSPINIIDARDGANLNVSPGDWHFDPNGGWFMMARDNRGASFTDPNGDPYCTGTALWKIDPATYTATRINNSCSPISGTGSTWLAAGKHLLSTSSGTTYVHNVYTETWDIQYNADDSGTNTAINDLASQWIIPDAILLCGWKNLDCDDPTECTTTLYEIKADEDTGEQICLPYESELTGKWGVCEKQSNPFVSDPSTKDEEFLSDQVWTQGCSDAGYTYFRVSYDPVGNPIYEYLYKGIDITEPTIEEPSGFCPIPCGEAATLTETIQFCNLDNTPPSTVFQKNFSDGSVEWFDETGIIPEPTDKTIGECPDIDPLLPVTEQIVCIDGQSYVRVLKETYTEDADGLPVLNGYQVIYYNENGIFYDSGVLDPTQTANEPSYDYLGDCNDPFVEIVNEKLCEKDARFLLLIDSGGNFARYSFFTKTWETVSTLSVASAGGSADVDNFLLYNFVAPDQMTVIDVNTDTQLPNVTIVDGIINPAVATNPKTFSAASFRDSDGYLYAWDTGGADVGLYKVNVSTGVVDFVTNITGVSGAGTSIAIDNTTDRLIIAGSNLSYDVDWITGVATVWTDPPIQPNGSTFDTDGNYYVTQGNNTYVTTDGVNYTQIIDDWSPGANSIAYYETVAQKPSCFHRRYGILADGSREFIGDYYIGTDEERTVVGEVDCCDGCGDSDSSNTTPSSVSVNNFPTYITQRTAICVGGVPTYLIDWSDGSKTTVSPADGEDDWCNCTNN